MSETASSQATTLFGRTVIIHTTGLTVDLDELVKYIERLFQRQAIKDMYGKINSGEVFVSFFNSADALFLCEQHHNNSIPSILQCTMANMDSLDMDVDKLWLHGDHVTDSMLKQRIQQMIQDKGYHVTGIIQYREPRCIIVCFNTKKLAALYDVFNLISVTYKCQFVRAHVRVRFNVNQLSKDEVVKTIKCKVGNDELMDKKADTQGLIVKLKTVESLQKLLKDKHWEVKKQQVTFELFYPCLTVEYYSNFQKEELEKRSKGKILKACAGEIILLEKSKYLSDIKVKYIDSVNIDLDKNKEEIYIYGDPLPERQVCSELELVLTEKFSSCPVNELGLEPGECEVLATEGFVEMTNLYFSIKQIHACMSRVNSQLVVHYDVASLTKAELKRVMCEYISRNEIELDPILCAVFCSTSWRSFYTRLKQGELKLRHTAFGVDVPNNKMIIYGPIADTEKIKSHMTKYLDEQFLSESIFTMDYSIYKYMKTFKPEKFQDVETICRQNGCRIERIENMFHFVGLEEGTILGLEIINNLRRLIKVDMISFDLLCCSEFLMSTQGQTILEEVGRKNGCLLELRGGRCSHTEIALPSACSYSGVLGAWHVYVVTCEPTRMQVDCFLNVMHVQRLKDDTPPFGFDGDFWNKLRTTDATDATQCRLILTGAGNKKGIPVIHIIHSGAKEKLLNDMKHGLQYAENLSENSLAISTSCTDEQLLQLVMINMQIIGSQPEFQTKPLKLYVCCSGLTQADSVANSLFLKAQHSLSSGRGLKRAETEHVKPETLYINISNDVGAIPYRFREITIFSTKINLIIGDIILVDSDAMVTSVRSNFDESRGMVMREVFTRGGADINEQLKQQYPNGLKDWDFAVSGAGKLPHKYLFHVCLPRSYFKTEEDKIIQLVFNVLEEASNLQLQSISIPALGTRALHFNPRKVCASILKAAQLYTEEYKMSSIRQINLVIYHTQAEIYAAFHEAFSDFKIARSSIISSTKRLLKNRIGNVTVNVLIDDVTNRNSEALLVTVHPSLDLTIGNISRAVLKSAGQETQDMLRQRYPRGIKDYEFATSSSGGLGYGRIYYIALPTWDEASTKKVKKLLVEVFEDIDKAGLASVSLPAIGTGGLEFPVAHSMEIIAKAIKLFSQTNPHCLVNFDVILHSDDFNAQQEYAKGLLEDIKTLAFVAKCFKYNQVTVTLKRSHLCHEDSDVIVISAGHKSVWTKCSKEFVKKFQATANDQNQTGFVQIKDPKWKLKCKELYILNTQVYKEAWQLGVYEVLKHAERVGVHSMSLSLIEPDCSYEELHKRVQDVHAGLQTFSTDVIKSLSDVRLVVDCPQVYSAACCIFDDLSTNCAPPKCANVSVYYTETARRSEAETQLKDSLKTHYKESILFSQFVSSFHDANSYRLKEKGFRNMLDVNIDKNTLKVSGFGDVTVLQKEIQQIEIEDWKKCMVGKSITEKWESSKVRDNVKLLPTSFEFMCVEKYYKDNGARGTVIQIERIENKKLCELYSSRKLIMDRKNPTHENEKILFHGANFNSTGTISETGFSRNTCGNHETLYGNGVYFSKSAEYAEKSALPSDTGILKIFLARVLVGYSVETTQGQLAIVQEPNSSRTYDSGKAPDSNEDGIVVIFTDSQAYPEYVITSKIHSSDTQTTSR